MPLHLRQDIPVAGLYDVARVHADDEEVSAPEEETRVRAASSVNCCAIPDPGLHQGTNAVSGTYGDAGLARDLSDRSLRPCRDGGAGTDARVADSERACPTVPSKPGVRLRTFLRRRPAQPAHRLRAEPDHGSNGTVRPLRMRRQDPYRGGAAFRQAQREAMTGVEPHGQHERILFAAVKVSCGHTPPSQQLVRTHPVPTVDDAQRRAVDDNRRQVPIVVTQQPNMLCVFGVPPWRSGQHQRRDADTVHLRCHSGQDVRIRWFGRLIHFPRPSLLRARPADPDLEDTLGVGPIGIHGDVYVLGRRPSQRYEPRHRPPTESVT
ncbi:hypothetical protein [Streptomyces nojiriensis]|uniref:hypothetical protein n=1 Tax=Streptomyces nojiriensis TaxID=66374 RepID=UPI0040630A0D